MRAVMAAVLALAIAVLPAPIVHAQNLLTNGSFELGPDPGMAMPVPMGSTAIPGWVVMVDALDYVGGQWNAVHGTRSIALNGTNPAGIQQTFPTVSDANYTVHFFMAGDAFSNPILKHMRVSAAGQSQDYEFDAGHSWPWELGWLEKTFAFTASGTSTTLLFTSLDAGDTGPTLDSVVVLGPTLLGDPDRPGPDFNMAPPAPNPTRRSMTISYVVPTRTSVRVSVFDARGREVAVLANSVHEPGPYFRTWDAAAERGTVAPGLYLIRLSAPGISLVRKAAVIP
ncbi:MAG: choice-of-anchor C family protein [Candidatus Eiseniibacteriota bacterium]